MDNYFNTNLNGEKSKNEYSNIILDTTYNSEESITKKNLALNDAKKPIFVVALKSKIKTDNNTLVNFNKLSTIINDNIHIHKNVKF